MNDLRKAAEMALEALEEYSTYEGVTATADKAVTALRQALAQPVDAVNISQERVDETEKREHEPWCDSVTKLLLSMPPQIPPCNCKPKREWVGLTHDEVDSWELPNCPTVFEFAQFIKAKLKEKNS